MSEFNYNPEEANKIAASLTDEKKEEYRKMGFEVASKSVLANLAKILNYKKRTDLAKKVLKLSYDRCNSISIEFNYANQNYKICSCIAPVDANYRTEVELPADFEYFKDLLDQFVLLKLITVTYWEHFKHKNPNLYSKIKEVLGELTFEEIEGVPNSLRYSAELDWYRVGIFCFIKDENDQVLVKK
jgi:hypothetical protein